MSKSAATTSRQIFGEHYLFDEDVTESSSTTTWVTKLTINTGQIPAGTYRVGTSFNWRQSSVSNNIIIRARVNGSENVYELRAAPKLAGPGQKNPGGGFGYTTLTAGSHTVDFQFKTDGGGTAYVRNVRLEFWRVS